MDSPVGSTEIRGTAGQPTVSIDADGNATGGVNMVEGSVSQRSIRILHQYLLDKLAIVQVDDDGQQIGATQTVEVPEEVTNQ